MTGAKLMIWKTQRVQTRIMVVKVLQLPFTLIFNQRCSRSVQARGEAKYRNNWMMPKKKYLNWPELAEKNENDFCKQYIRHHHHPLLNLNGLRTESGLDLLQYLEAPDKDEGSNASNKVKVLYCDIGQRSNGRYYYITRAPTSNCVLWLVYPPRNIKILYIADEHCEFKKTRAESYQKSLGLHYDYATLQSSLMGNTQIGAEKEAEYEKSHFNMHYLSNPDEYTKWPEMKRKHKSAYCCKFLKKIYPDTDCSDVFAICLAVHPLYYLHLTDENKQKYSTVNVLTLHCHQPRARAGNSIYYFLSRGPRPECAYLLDIIDRHRLEFRITNEHCCFGSATPSRSRKRTAPRAIVKSSEENAEVEIILNKVHLPDLNIQIPEYQERMNI